MRIDTKCEAKIEPFDSFWEAPSDIEKGYKKFDRFYSRNYLKYLKIFPFERILVVSCGPGYFLSLLDRKGFSDILGIDSDPEKIKFAIERGLNAKATNAVDFLEKNRKPFNVIILEQEINHLTKSETILFLRLCYKNLKPGGRLVIHSLNGANPITGAEALAQNFDHYNTLTEYSLSQVLEYCGYRVANVFPLNLYVFYENPLNYVGMFIDAVFRMIFRVLFIFYGKHNRIFSKKIAAVAFRPGV